MIVKILFVKDAAPLEKYLREKQGPGNPVTERDTTLEGMTEDFRRTQDQARTGGRPIREKKNANQAIHLIQSWSPEESRKLTPEEIHRMGEALVTRFAPGHAFVLETHTDEAHAHNHIVLNPVHPETGVRIQNKKAHLHRLREWNDEIAREWGLEVLPRQACDRAVRGQETPGLEAAHALAGREGPSRGAGVRASDKVRRIESYRGRSYILDLASKAQFARAHATSYEEFGAILSAFDIQTRVEEKNITYFYPGRAHGKRGRNLDPRLDKPALEIAFSENSARLARDPEGRQALAEWTSLYAAEMRPRGSTGIAPAATPAVATGAREESAAGKRAAEVAAIPEAELGRAKTQNLVDYCRRTGIGLVAREGGGFALKGRDYVNVSEHGWVNTRNRTRGTIVDFVAIHRGVSYLEAVAAVNENPRLLLLRGQADRVRSFQSFHVPRGESASREVAVAALSRLLDLPVSHPVHAALMRRQQAWVGRDGAIAFLPKRGGGAIEYRLDSRGEYEPATGELAGASGNASDNVSGIVPGGAVRNASAKASAKTLPNALEKTPSRSSGAPFFSARAPSHRPGDRLRLFLDPREFLRREPGIYIDPGRARESVLVLLGPDPAPVLAFCAGIGAPKRIQIVDQGQGQERDHGRDGPGETLAHELRERLGPFEIDVSCAWEPPGHEAWAPPTVERSLELSI